MEEEGLNGMGVDFFAGVNGHTRLLEGPAHSFLQFLIKIKLGGFLPFQSLLILSHLFDGQIIEANRSINPQFFRIVVL